MSVDTSALLAVILQEPERASIVARTIGFGLLAPEVLPYEVGNALSALKKRRTHEAGETLLAWQVFISIPIKLERIDIAAALAVAARQGIYANDAYTIQCARETGSPLLSLDRRLCGAARSEGVPLLEDAP